MDTANEAATGRATFDAVVDVLNDFVRNTEDTVHAAMLLLIVNLHGYNLTTDSSGNGGLSPGSINNALGPMSDYIYKPSNLADDRHNLNSSWFSSPDPVYYPITEYFTTYDRGGGILSTLDGWPGENYIQMLNGKRMLAGWGNIDHVVSATYDITSDSHLFAQGVLNNNDDKAHGPQIVANGSVISGCLFDPHSTDFSRVANSSASWAQASAITTDTVVTSTHAGVTAATNHSMSALPACGFSPLLNSTLGNSSAAAAPAAYRAVAAASIWSWAPGEPADALVSGSSSSSSPSTSASSAAAPSSSVSASSESAAGNRCVVMDMATAGRWRAADCSFSYRAACRIANQPFQWILTANAVSYDGASGVGTNNGDGNATGMGACPPNSSFSVPRTGLENRYLFEQARIQGLGRGLDRDLVAYTRDDANTTNSRLWLNLNSLDRATCWVPDGGSGGDAHARCPYLAGAGVVQRGNVLIATIAAVIALVITALMVFVKCNVNRQNSRRRRVIEGWEYEGVPA